MASLLLCAFCASSFAQNKAPVADLLSVTLGKRYPVHPLFEAKVDNDVMPYLTFSAPMPATSKLNMFLDYEVATMKDNGNVHSLIAKRAYDSAEARSSVLKVVAASVTAAYRLIASRSDMSSYEAAGPDTTAQASCAYGPASPYPLLLLRIESTSERTRANQQLKERMSKRFPPK